MKRQTIKLWEKEEYSYPFAGEFLPNIETYLHEDDQIRPAMVVVPGGGYSIVSPTEGEIVAKRFYEAGYQAFVLTYSTNTFQLEPLKMLPLRDISRAVRYVRKHAAEMNLQKDRIVCCGFSAGAHLVGSLAVHYQDALLKEEPDSEISNRPDATLLCYPVITSGGKAHLGSFDRLFGADASREELTWASLEKQVTLDTPPAFLWQTMTDETVPVENSILYAKACEDVGVPCELHLFMEGRHGLSLANEDWAANRLGKDSIYTMMQQWQTLKTLDTQDPDRVPEMFHKAAKAETLREFYAEWNKASVNGWTQEKQYADASAMQWPDLALAWLDKIFR